MKAPTTELVRVGAPAGGEFRSDDPPDGYLGTLTGHFAVFNEWTQIDSVYEGRFLERMAPGAFTKTIGERRDHIKVLYDHGQNARVGNMPLGPIVELREDDRGVFYEVLLADTSYNRDLLPLLRDGLLGASFRFRVINDDWDDTPKRGGHNPQGLPERTVREVALAEFGPVTFPAYDGATAGVRSGTDTFLRHLLADPVAAERIATLLATPADGAAPQGTPNADGAGTTTSNEPDGAPLGLTHGQRAAYLRSLTL